MRSLILAGMENGVIKLVNGMDRDLFDPAICCLMDSTETARSRLQGTVPLHELNDCANGINFSLIQKLSSIFREYRIDIVHSHNWGTFFYTVLAARLAKVPVHIHGEHGRDTRDQELGWKRKLVWNTLKGFVTHYVAVSENIAADMVNLMNIPRGKIATIPNGVDTSMFRKDPQREQVRRKLGLETGHKIAGTVGWLREVKDHETLIKAFAIVKKAEPKGVLLIIGKSPREERIKELLFLVDKLGLSDSVLFLGERMDVADLIMAMDVYVNSSVYEGMSNTILEAMASGRPVVATHVGGTPGIVLDGTTGILVPPRDENSMASAIISLFRDNGTSARMGEAACRRIEERHSLQRMIEMNQNLYIRSYGLNKSQ